MPVDYSKWDNLEDSDDDKPQPPPRPMARPPPNRPMAPDPANGDMDLNPSFLAEVDRKLRGNIPDDRRSITTRFICGSCHGAPGGQNESFVEKSLASYPWLLETKHLSQLRLSYEDHVKSVGVDKPPPPDDPASVLARSILEAVNTLAAVRKFGSAPALFHALKSRGPDLKARYRNLEFARENMLEGSLGDDYDTFAACTLGETPPSKLYRRVLQAGTVVSMAIVYAAWPSR
jgi:hypothetical protein